MAKPEGAKADTMARDEAYKLAEQKIEEALRPGATELDLRSMKSTELPESIGQLKQLRKLDLGHEFGDYSPRL